MILKAELLNQIKEINLIDKKELIVLKGINLEDVIDEKADLKVLIENKFAYFSNIMISRKIVSMEEYILLSDFFNSQFQKINFLENNLYFNYFPLNEKLSEIEIESLVNFYDDESKEDKEELETIKFFTDVYGNIEKIGEKYYCVYSDIENNENFTFTKLFLFPVVPFPISPFAL